MPPKFKAPLPKDKMIVTPDPPELQTMLETYTAVQPIESTAAPTEVAPAESAGAESAPIKNAPAESAPIKNAPAESAPAKEPAKNTKKSAISTQVITSIPKETSIPVVSTSAPSTDLVELEGKMKREIEKDTIGVKVTSAVPSTRRAFANFMLQTFRSYYLKERSKEFDPKACEVIKSASKGEQKAFKYQQLIRDYMQRTSPFRGILVNHGLGSGKSCTSIAAIEALMSTGPVIIMTPASLRPNYVAEIQKCGPFLFRTNNHWEFLPVPSTKDISPEYVFLLNVMKMSRKLIETRKGAWIPIPESPSNFDSLPGSDQDEIRRQIEEHIQERFQFVNYNGLRSETVREWACNTPRMFDGATIVIDEVHNLVRMINNSDLEKVYTDSKRPEPRTLSNYMPAFCKIPKKYSPAYLLYRMICNAVGAKIIALSATPIINFPQEIGILANLLGGDIRLIKTTVSLSEKDTVRKTLEQHPELDFVEVESSLEGMNATVIMTPIPSGFKKVFEGDEMKGILRDETITTDNEEMDRERNLPALFKRIKDAIPSLGDPIFSCTTRLPDLHEKFQELFIDPIKLEVYNNRKFILMSRLSGLISYYKGEDPNMMAKANPDTIFELDMSDLQLGNYTEVRQQEIVQEGRQFSSAVGGSEMYSLITKKISATFKIFSRAVCNFAFPEDMKRPRPAHAKKLVDIDPTDSTIEEPEEEESETTYEELIQHAIDNFKIKKEEYFSKGKLQIYSPKYQKMLDTLLPSPGPVLVYTQFKTLEGITLFTMALEQQQNYGAMDIESDGKGSWHLKETTKAGGKRPRYIQYTGNVNKEKRDILKAIFNAEWSKIPSSLAEEVKTLVGQDHNRDGMIVKVFMITQSGAEGISLSNVRQVHIMEPYWNKVRTDQVKGRAIRICSHADLDPKDRIVDTFFYIMKFGKDQLEKGTVIQTFKIKDKSFTTDQTILKIAESKEHLNTSILNIMKASAIDCELNKKENGFTQACYWFPQDKDHPTTMTKSMKYLFHPIIEKDITIQESSIKSST